MSDTIVYPEGSGTAVRTLFGYHTQDHPKLDRIQNGISMISAVLAGISVVAMVILTIAEVVARVGFRSPLGWNISLIEQYLMMAGAFFGMVVAYRSGAHIAVVTLFARFGPRTKKVLMLFGLIAVAIGLGYLMYSGTRAAAFSLMVGEQPPVGMSELPWPTWTWKSIIPVASLMGLAIVLIDIYREVTSPWTAPATDYDPGESEGTDY